MHISTKELNFRNDFLPAIIFPSFGFSRRKEKKTGWKGLSVETFSIMPQPSITIVHLDVWAITILGMKEMIDRSWEKVIRLLWTQRVVLCILFYSIFCVRQKTNETKKLFTHDCSVIRRDVSQVSLFFFHQDHHHHLSGERVLSYDKLSTRTALRFGFGHFVPRH